MSGPDYQSQIDSVTASEWSDHLDRFQDANIYQTWSYGAVRWGERNLSHLVLRCGGEVVGIAQLRIIHLRGFKGGIAYLRWGPLCHRRGENCEFEIFQRMAVSLHDEYVSRRRLYLRIVPNAFAGTPYAELFRSAFSRLGGVRWNPWNLERTFLLDLSPPLDDLRKALDQKWRNQLNRAEKNGLKVIAGDGIKEYQSFLEIYKEMWKRKRFETTVDVDEFAHIQDELAIGHRMKILICTLNDKPVAGIVCSALGNSAIYLLGATSDSGLQAKGAYLLQWTMIRWLKEHGFQYYDLGGINPDRNPGVYHFKQGLSGRDVSRIELLESCENPLSRVLMNAADFTQGGLGAFLSKLAKRGACLMFWRKSRPGCGA
jgi:hypothetical protein